MNEQLKTGTALIASFLLLVVGAFRIFTDQLEDMSLIVAYIFAFSGLIGVITNGWKWKTNKY
ncbi:hypothetical protein [Halobacillus litoralis]|uniref:hypothetical protein n=1 Tax=Halobacillus litoralis TaxID=45668 RepID=UPI001CFD8CB3|nr:hypothetical protein [Halobacillus litoralis]